MTTSIPETDVDDEPMELTVEEFHGVLENVFNDIVEQHGLGEAFTQFLSTIGFMAVETNTVPQTVEGLQLCAEAMFSSMAQRGKITLN